LDDDAGLNYLETWRFVAESFRRFRSRGPEVFVEPVVDMTSNINSKLSRWFVNKLDCFLLN